jgi:hypothetical protein
MFMQMKISESDVVVRNIFLGLNLIEVDECVYIKFIFIVDGSCVVANGIWVWASSHIEQAEIGLQQ